MVGGASGSNAVCSLQFACPAIERMRIFLGDGFLFFFCIREFTLAIRLDLEPSTEAVPAAPRRRARRGRAGTRRAGITMGARVLIRFDFASSSHCQWEPEPDSETVDSESE